MTEDTEDTGKLCTCDIEPTPVMCPAHGVLNQ
jgi:metal-sulfur cluster biosynthetic enzyme